jgi:electron transport complex protein RnfB
MKAQDKKAYEQFIKHMHRFLIGLPDSKVLLPLLTRRISPEEADFLKEIPFLPHSIEELAQKFKIAATELSAKLDPLAERGLVFRHESKETVRYALNDSMFVFYRSPFWAGKNDQENRDLARLSNQYYLDGYGREFGAYPTMGLRALPIYQTIEDPRRIRPFEDVIGVVEREDFFCVAHCACRERKNLDPDSPCCKHEILNCLHFGRLARYMVQQGLGIKISREEAIRILDASADEGLVHGVSVNKTGIDTICNCCSCCCMFLESVHILNLKGHEPSNYILKNRSETCQGCGVCVQRCPMKALKLKTSPSAKNKTKKTAVLESDRCIGCGVCVHKCPSRSLFLIHRQEEMDYPENLRELAERMILERGKDPLQVFKIF